MEDHDSSTQQQMLLDMMKQHISNGLPLHYSTNCNNIDPFLHQNTTSEEDTSLVMQEENENEQMPMPIVYKKRARIKFTPEQLDILEATFQEHRYPTVDIVDDLVEQLDLPTQKITVWFQNRRARLKKNQQKHEDRPQSLEKDDPQYDSGIHVNDEDVSRGSSTSPLSSSNSHCYLPPPNYLPSSMPQFMPSSSPYYSSYPHPNFYNNMWHNFRYSLATPSIQSTMGNGMPFNLANYGSSFSSPPSDYHSPFMFQDMTNFQHQPEFHGEL